MSIIKNILVIIVSTALTLMLLEVGLSLAFPDKVKERKISGWDNSDPLLPRHADGVLFYSATHTHPTFVDSGFRVVKNNCVDPGALKILVVGDSNVAGMFVDDGYDLGSQLAKSLNRGGCYLVKAFGVSGFGPDQSILEAERFVKRENFDFVILHVFADNDAGDLIRNNHALTEPGVSENPGYCFHQKSWPDNLLLTAVLEKLVFVVTGDYLIWNKARHSLGRDELCVTVYNSPGTDLFDTLLNRAAVDKKLLRDGKMQLYVADRYDIDFACQPDSDLRDFVDAKLRAVADDFAHLSIQYRFKPLLLIQPSEYDVTTNNAELSTTMRRKCNNYLPENLVNIFVGAFRDKVDIINLFDAFRGCNECYFSEEELDGDNHWNQHGIQIAAESVAKSVLQSGQRAGQQLSLQ